MIRIERLKTGLARVMLAKDLDEAVSIASNLLDQDNLAEQRMADDMAKERAAMDETNETTSDTGGGVEELLAKQREDSDKTLANIGTTVLMSTVIGAGQLKLGAECIRNPEAHADAREAIASCCETLARIITDTQAEQKDLLYRFIDLAQADAKRNGLEGK